MRMQTVPTGVTIYREGDPSVDVHFIQSGEVEILKDLDGSKMLLSVLGSGEILGEVGVVRNQPRSATVRARTRVELLTLTRAEFLAAFGTENGVALNVLKMLCERLVRADARLMAATYGQEQVRAAQIGQLLLFGDSEVVVRQIGTDPVEVRPLPFRVGRRFAGGSPDREAGGLALDGAGTPHLSSFHFSIELARESTLIVRDLDSRLGTIVNGRRISPFELSTVEPLHFGSNVVVAGAANSPFRFRIEVERL